MGVEEFTDKFLELLPFSGQALDTDTKKAKRYVMKLHSRYSSLVQSAERESFHTVVDMARRMEASAIVEGSVTQSSGVKTPGRGGPGFSSQSSGKKRWDNTTRKPKKNKFWNKLKSGLGFGGGSSSGSDGTECQRCGRPHRGVCRAGTNACFRC